MRECTQTAAWLALLTRVDGLCRMSDAVDNAEVMLYAVSEKYKESGN